MICLNAVVFNDTLSLVLDLAKSVDLVLQVAKLVLKAAYLLDQVI